MNPDSLNQRPLYPYKRFFEEGKETAKAQLIRGMLEHREELLYLDPWLAFPQNACCFNFGKTGSPLPIGALFLLWEKCPPMTGDCPECGGKVYGFGFGGLLATGGVIGVCLECEEKVSCSLGGLGSVDNVISPVLKDTPYYLHGALFGGCYGAVGLDLRMMLERLGQKNLPPAWSVAKLDAAAACMERTIPRDSSTPLLDAELNPPEEVLKGPMSGEEKTSSDSQKPAGSPGRINTSDAGMGKKSFFAKLFRYFSDFFDCKWIESKNESLFMKLLKSVCLITVYLGIMYLVHLLQTFTSD